MDMRNFYTYMIAMVLCMVGLGMEAQTTPPGNLLLPLVFDKQKVLTDTIATPAIDTQRGNPEPNYDRSWIDSITTDDKRVDALRYRTMLRHPQDVPYNAKYMRKAPQQ